jgi:MFS superfamily sulfate permease-like transporter
MADDVRGPATPPAPWQNPGVLRQFIAMPPGVRVFLGYAFLILAGIGVFLPAVVDTAIDTPSPVALPGLVVMTLLAYTIFTVTLTLQRKEVARGLALGLSSLTLPAVPLLVLARLYPAALFVTLLAIVLFVGLTRAEVRTWLNEP